jgi:hypothetical protein
MWEKVAEQQKIEQIMLLGRQESSPDANRAEWAH